MGFYGNIRNTTNNSFKFDLIYSNRTVMEQNANLDGIFGGRFVLVEYDQAMSEVPIRDGGINYKIYKVDNKFYTDFKVTKKENQIYEYNDDGDVISSIRELQGYYLSYTPAAGFDTAEEAIESLVSDAPVADNKIIGIYKAGIKEWKNKETKEGFILNTANGAENFVSKEDKWYDKNEYADEQEGIDSRPILGEEVLYYGITENNGNIRNIENDPDDAYTVNYTIDKYNYGNGRGYDSTVWRKVYDEDGVGRYVMLAELNSVVPTFAVVGNPPQLTDDGYPGATPFTPYFDQDSTNVFYKLHITTPWDFRVASLSDWKEYDENKTSPMENSSIIHISDNKIIKTVPGDIEKRQRNIIEYQKSDNNWISVNRTETYDSAIYFNKTGFTDLDYSHNVEPTDITTIGDTILVRPIGKSGRQYTSTDAETGMSKTQEEIDTQELAIILPTIGNVISEVYDKLYGPGIKTEEAKIVYDDNGVEQYWPNGDIKYEYDVVEDKPRQRGIHWEDPADLHIDDGRHRMVTDKNDGYYYSPLRDNPDGSLTAPQRVDSLAGAINSVHDMLGMIITKHLPAQKSAGALEFAELPGDEDIYLPNAYPYYIYCEPLYELVYVREHIDGQLQPAYYLPLTYIPTSDKVRVEGKTYYRKQGDNYRLHTGSISTGEEQFYEVENLYRLENGYMVLASEAKAYNGSNLDQILSTDVKYYRETGNNNFFYAAKSYGYKELDMTDPAVKASFIPVDGNYGYEQHKPISNEIEIKKYTQDKYRQIGETKHWVFDDGEKAYAESLYYDLPATLTWAGRLSGGADDIYTRTVTNNVIKYTKADKDNMQDGVQYYTLSNNYKVKTGTVKTYSSTGGETGSTTKLKEYYVPEWIEHYFVYNTAKGFTFWRDSVPGFAEMSLEEQRNKWNTDANAGKIYHNFSADTFGWGGTPVPSSDGETRMEYNFYVYTPGVHYVMRTNQLTNKVEYITLTGNKDRTSFTCPQEFRDYIEAVCRDNSTYKYDKDERSGLINLWRKDGEKIVAGDEDDPDDIKIITNYSRCPLYKFIFEDPENPFFAPTEEGDYNQITTWRSRNIMDGGSAMDENDPNTWPYGDAYVRLTGTLVTPYKKNTYYVIEKYDDSATGAKRWDDIVFGLNDGTITSISTRKGNTNYCKVLEFKLATSDNVQPEKIYWSCSAPTLAGVGISPKLAANGFEPYLSAGKEFYFVDNVLEWAPEPGRFKLASTQNEDFAEIYGSDEPIQYYIEEKLCIIDPGSFDGRFSLYQLWNFNVIQSEEDYDFFFNPEAHSDDPDWKPVRLGYKVDTYVKRNLQGFARDLNTMHGLLLRINEMLQAGDYRTRDENTVQGCINILHDLFEKFDKLVPASLLGVNQFGEIESKKLADVILLSDGSSPIGTLTSPQGDVPITTEETLRSGIEKLIDHINNGASNITLNEYNNYYDDAPYFVTTDDEKQPGKTYYIKQGNTFIEYTADPWPTENRPTIYERYEVINNNIPDVDSGDNISEAIAKLQWQLNHIANRKLTDLSLNYTSSTAPLADTDTLGNGLHKLQNRIYNIENFQVEGINNESGLTNIFAGIVRSNKVPTNLTTGMLGTEVSVPALKSGWIWVDTVNHYIYIKTQEDVNLEDNSDAITRNYWELLNAWQ